MKELAKQLFLKVGGDKYLRSKNKTPRVLFWHGVHNKPNAKIEAESIDKTLFIDQIEYLIKHFEIISIDEFYLRLTNQSFRGNEVVLTFDDGYKNNLNVLAPVMKNYNLPFTIYVSTNNISSGDLYPTSIARLAIYGSEKTELKIKTLNAKLSLETDKSRDETARVIMSSLKTSSLSKVKQICVDIIENFDKETWNELVENYKAVRVMTWNDLRVLVKDYNCVIGSHCLDHICCHENQDADEIKTQIIESKKIIESELKIKCDYFAFPNGDYTNLSKEAVSKAGYKLGFTTGNKRIDTINPDFTAIPRISIPFNLATFKIVTNLYPK